VVLVDRSRVVLAASAEQAAPLVARVGRPAASAERPLVSVGQPAARVVRWPVLVALSAVSAALLPEAPARVVAARAPE
jgi:hypothetical protein